MKQQDKKDQQIVDRVLRNGRQADYALLVDSYRTRLFAFVATQFVLYMASQYRLSALS